MDIENKPVPQADMPPNPGLFEVELLYLMQPDDVLERHRKHIEFLLDDAKAALHVLGAEEKRRSINGPAADRSEELLPEFSDEEILGYQATYRERLVDLVGAYYLARMTHKGLAVRVIELRGDGRDPFAS